MADAAQPGPLVGRGRSADVTYSWIILKTSAPPRLTITTRLMSAFGRGAFPSLFVRHFDPAEVKRTIPQAADFLFQIGHALRQRHLLRPRPPTT